MPDVTRQVLLDHETLRIDLADLHDAQASGQPPAIIDDHKGRWIRLAAAKQGTETATRVRTAAS